MINGTVDKFSAKPPEIAPATVSFTIPAYENFGTKTVKVTPKKAYAVYMKLSKDERVE